MPARRLVLAAGGMAGLSMLAAATVPGLADQPEPGPPQHIRGTLKSLNDRTMVIDTPRGRTETVVLGPNAGLYRVKPATLADIHSGEFVGVTSVEQGGKRVAREVHVFTEALRGLGEGHYPWDLDTGPNMMTNANIAQVQEVGGDRVLRLAYKGGEQTISVQPNTSIVSFDRSTQDQLVAGRQVFVIARKEADGKLTAAAVVVGEDGIKPPM
jgi:hypothetical protein